MSETFLPYLFDFSISNDSELTTQIVGDSESTSPSLLISIPQHLIHIMEFCL